MAFLPQKITSIYGNNGDNEMTVTAVSNTDAVGDNDNDGSYRPGW